MRALILAAGKGTRLGRLTQTTPKALMKITGEALISRLVRQCAAAGVDQITVVVGHEADQIEQALAQAPGGVVIDYVHNPDYAKTNNIVSLRLGLEHLRQCQHVGALLLIECDVVVEDAVLPKIIEAPQADCALLSPFQPGMDGTVVRLEDGNIRDLYTTDRQGSFFRFDGTYKTVNVYKLSHRLWSSKLARLIDWYIDEVSTSAYYENAIGMITYASGDALAGTIIHPREWSEIDDPNDLRIARAVGSTQDLARELERSHGGWWDFDLLDFAYLRNMHFPPPALIAQLRERLEAAIFNYGSSQQVLDDKMSWFLETDAAETVALGGLSGMYPLLVDHLNSEATLIPAPSFGEYGRRFPVARPYDATMTTVRLDQEIRRGRPRDVVLVNPNNPTGTLHGTGDLIELARAHSSVTFWVDESFLPFTGEQSLSQSGSTPPNVVVLASLSKNLGVPGLRLGFAWSRNTELLDLVRERLPIWGLPSLAEVFLTLGLKFKPQYATSLARTAVDKATFASALRNIPGVEVRSGVHGNFLLIEASQLPSSSSAELVHALLEQRVLVKDVTDRLGGAHPTLRVAVRTEDDNRVFAESLADCLAQLSSA